ncbi:MULTISPECIES: AEC family transporter [unclassified Cryobacterium]|uniref:AEC family transporter n=1 Tax=unclassified Cryobacterium TaxID=2649013 RepID=UPI00106CDE6A|nr:MULTISPECIES: AEC family transporter [unclassified Cryobacterium]TFD07445.1 AEC family transporter [Cryobacterium sp. TMT1-66-1]TFD14340.1 AEC family transporter [Cryobacterium sp. TMT1-2-2]
MGGVLVGFSIIGFVILIGYFVERFSLVGAGAGRVLNRMAYFVATPALLFTVLSHADVSVLFSEFLAAIVCTVLVGALLYVVASRLFFRTPLAETVLGASSATYINVNNIGLPVAIYVLGSAQYVAPVVLLQLVILAPTILAILDLATHGRASLRSILTQPFRNPMILASLAGVVVAVSGITLPDPVLAPFELIGGAAIPMVLLSFGMSLHGQRLLQAGTGRKQVVVATVIKVVLAPIIAYLFGHFVFDLDGAQLFAVVAVSALPTAQNIFNFASRYDRAIVVTRDTVLLTTILSMPALIVVAALLA